MLSAKLTDKNMNLSLVPRLPPFGDTPSVVTLMTSGVLTVAICSQLAH